MPDAISGGDPVFLRGIDPRIHRELQYRQSRSVFSVIILIWKDIKGSGKPRIAWRTIAIMSFRRSTVGIFLPPTDPASGTVA
jgi:hypothetical protein